MWGKRFWSNSYWGKSFWSDKGEVGEPFGFIYRLPAITGSHNNFVVTLTVNDFPSGALNGDGNSIYNGGGNLIAYTDKTKAVRLPVEIVLFSSGASPNAIVFIKIPIASTGKSIYIEADQVEISQPAVNAPFGRNSVWVDYESVLHLNETGTNGVFADSTGNGHDTTLTTGASLPTTSSNHPFGGTWPDFDKTQALTLTLSAQMLNSSPLTVSHWVNMDDSNEGAGDFGNRYSLPDQEWVQQTSGTRFFLKGQTVEDISNPSGSYTENVNHLITGSHDSSRLDSYLDGFVFSSDQSISNPSGIISPIGMDFRIGTYFDNITARRADGRIGEVRAKKVKDSNNRVLTEYENQSSTLAWGSVGDWNNDVLIKCFIGFISKIDSSNTGMQSNIDSENTGMQSVISDKIGMTSVIVDTLGAISVIDADNTGMESAIDDSATGMESKICQC